MSQPLAYSSFKSNGTNSLYSASPLATKSVYPAEFNPTKYSNNKVLKTKNGCAGTKSKVVAAQGIYKNLFGGKYTRRRKHHKSKHRRHRRHRKSKRQRRRHSMHHKSKRRRSRHRRHSRRYRKKGGQSQLNPSTINTSNSGMDPILNYSYGQGYGFSGDKVSLNGLGAVSPTPHTSYAKCKLNVVRENL